LSIHKPFPILREGNFRHYADRNPSSIAWGPAGTGKTLASLFKLVRLATIFPNTRWFIVRKTKSSLAESALVTLERDVFGEDSPILLSRPIMRKTRDFYEFPNGSVIVCAGMDKPEKLFSTEYNGGYVQEATELEQDEWESLKRSLRAPFTRALKLSSGNPAKPFYQLWGDCNPTFEHHWIKQSIDSGIISGHESRHEDNPRFHDGANWTAAGKEYLDKQLGTLTGFMRKRLLEGRWAAAEGLVYDAFDPKIHVLDPQQCQAIFGGPVPPASWARYWAIDWGWTDPLVLQFWAKDGDGRMYLYREYYHTEKLVEDVAAWALNEVEMKREPRPKAVICDHDPTNAAAFTRHAKIACTLADKADRKKGIQQVQTRLRVQGDGKPRLFMVKGALTHPFDAKLRAKGKPTSTIEEMRSYVWNPKRDEPEDGNDHGNDSMRYCVSHVDAGGGWGMR
jgi:hypothetical protein